LKRLFKYLILTLACLSLLYAVVLFIFVVKEPNFLVPLKIAGGEIPIRNDDYGEGHFGAKRKYGRIHKGIDIEGVIGEAVYASKSGFAVCKDLKTGYGKLIVIYHPGNYQTRYGHLSRFSIRGFQWVNRANVIGSVGRTGNANYKGIKPHLHFEIRKGGKPLDPMKRLKRRQT
jgi:murein DD-endopeptidase MepM/ murein hydrolase activator NlpD